MLGKKRLYAQIQAQAQRLAQAVQDAEAYHDRALQQAGAERDRELAQVERNHRFALDQARQRFDLDNTAAASRQSDRRHDAKGVFDQHIADCRSAYGEARDEWQRAEQVAPNAAGLLAAGWSDALWADWEPTGEETLERRLPRAICIGTLKATGLPQALRSLGGHTGAVHGCVFLGDDGSRRVRLLSVAGDGNLCWWDVGGGRPVDRKRAHDGGVGAIAAHAANGLLVTGGADGVVRLWNGGDGSSRQALKEHVGAVYAVALSADANLVASGGDDFTVRLWDVAGARLLRTLTGHERPISGLAFSPAGGVLASVGQDGRVRLWEMPGGRELRVLADRGQPMHAVAFSPGGTLLATGGDDRVVTLWDVASGRELRKLAGHTGAVQAVAFSPDGAVLTSAGDDATVRRWEVDSGRQRDAIPETEPITAMALAPDGKTLALGLRSGTIHLRTEDADSAGWEQLTLPALMPLIEGTRLVDGESFTGGHNLIFKVPGAKKAQALRAIQALIVRLLALIPPGKVRFTLFDPVGLGDNVGPFMELNEYSPALTGGRAWTESAQIERELTELTEHMSMVMQTYLRGQYKGIEDYNRDVGEVTEPYRVIVALDFPANMTETACKRLASLAERGPALGVYSVMLVDTDRPLPAYAQMSALERHATVIAWDGERFVWHDDDFRDCAIELQGPPLTVDDDGVAKLKLKDDRGHETLFGRVIAEVGKQARDATAVKVRFTRMIEVFQHQLEQHRDDYPGLYRLPGELTLAGAPDGQMQPLPPRWLDLGTLGEGADLDTLWRSTTQFGLVGLLGRAGARKIQCLQLGAGDAHHVLVAGRTGSGKTTLLHTLITSLALIYSPWELSLYLIDLKKGVEFQRYRGLPHARVVAIASEREFAGSVLDELDRELTRRGELFQSEKVADLASYRAKVPEGMPRVLVIVDEFQELFAVSDRTAQRAVQVIDRLVRQGRGFGVHVLLGSQSLSSAVSGTSLQKSTLDQMAARIALMCSEADSQLILAGDNPKARQLNRPGQAIYNDSNGRLEGNSEFQGPIPKSAKEVQVELAAAGLQVEQTQDHEETIPGEQERYLRLIHRKAAAVDYKPDHEQVVFDGNQFASIDANRRLKEQIGASGWADDAPAAAGRPAHRAEVWLGEPIAIKEPTAAVFKRVAGRNLLVVGSEEQTIGAALSAMVSLAAQHRPGNRYDPTAARLYLLDFTDDEQPHYRLLPRAAGELPHNIRVGTARAEAAELLAELAKTLELRLRYSNDEKPPVYALLYSLQRARDLRAGAQSAWHAKPRRAAGLSAGVPPPFSQPPTSFAATPIATRPEETIYARPPVPPEIVSVDPELDGFSAFESWDDWQAYKRDHTDWKDRFVPQGSPYATPAIPQTAAEESAEDSLADADPLTQLLALLKEGPEQGVHVLAFCDTGANLLRAIEREGLREFGLRAVFPASVGDSRLLLDGSEEAAQLQPYRALFYDDSGRLEKFRPYGSAKTDPSLAAQEWLAWIAGDKERALVGVGEKLRAKAVAQDDGSESLDTTDSTAVPSAPRLVAPTGDD